jgi:hypothetical protein
LWLVASGFWLSGAVVEMHIGFREIDAAAGSFDYVRLAPHFAQDDKGFKGSLTANG